LTAERLSPSTAPITFNRKGAEYRLPLRSHLQRAHMPQLDYVMRDIDEYDLLMRGYGGTDLHSAKVFQIGHGARPYRLIALQSMGVHVEGVDVEHPILRGTPAESRAAWLANGPERALKSILRRAIFDPRELAQLRRELASRGLSWRCDPSRLRVCDAAEVELPEASLDLVLSEEVFQHVKVESLLRIVPAMARWLRPGGLALIRPNVYTGITGGMLQEWSRWSLEHPPRSKRSDPWEHLRRRRYSPNAYVNGLTRADYRELFTPHFELLEEKVKEPGLGREHFTPAVAADLAEWPEEEEFSNCTMFVLRRPPVEGSRSTGGR
jgi:SAM-dependent methyltransferase